MIEKSFIAELKPSKRKVGLGFKIFGRASHSLIGSGSRFIRRRLRRAAASIVVELDVARAGTTILFIHSLSAILEVFPHSET
jgi:hypothetical protein